MRQILTEASALVDAAPETVYAVLADYREGHPAILPKPYFTSLEVERGGYGEGTVLRVGMKVMGVERHYHSTVTEPVPGQVLVETDKYAGSTTTFTVVAAGNGNQSHVTIATSARAGYGIAGKIETVLAPLMLRRIYMKELAQLARVVTTVSRSSNHSNQ